MNCTNCMLGRPAIKKSEISDYKNKLCGFQSWNSVENTKENNEIDEEDMLGVVETEIEHVGSHENGSSREGSKERNGASKRINIPTRGNHHENSSPRMAYQCVPSNIPNLPEILRSESYKRVNDYWSGGDDDDEEEEKIPPHELIAKQNDRNQLSSFSVYEGAGRTLKGRDLSRVRNAILTRTSFVD